MDYETPRDSQDDTETANLAPQIAAAATAAERVGGIPLLPGPDNVVVLPEGVSLDDLEVRGRDLVVETADGRVFVIPDGAVFVPVIVVDGVAVPPLNLAAYLTGEQPEPAAGTIQSSGGNFADPAGPIQPAFGLGDLLPYTELGFPGPETQEIIPYLVNNEPEITSVPATSEVREAHLASTTPSRSDESQGSAFDGNAETTSNVVTFSSPDGVDSVTVNGVAINPGALPQVVASDDTGTLVISAYSFDSATGTGSFTYIYTLNDNTLNTDGSQVSFPISVTDPQGDTASDILTISIIDDAPTAFPNTNSVEEGGSVSGDVLTDQDPDIFGADGPAATNPAGGVIGVRAAGGDTTSEVTGGTGSQIQGLFGTLTLNANGTYTYVADANITDVDVQDVFVYTIEDDDGDRSTTTLTIDVGDVSGTASDNDAIVDESGLDGIGSQIVPDGEFFTGGQITITGANGPFTYTLISPADGIYGTLTLDPETGAYSYTLDTPFDEQPDANNGRDTINDGESFEYQVTDQNGNIVGTGTIDVDIVDDVPSASADFDTVNEGGTATGNVLPNDIFGADGPAATLPAGGVIGVRAANGDITTPVSGGTGTEIQGLYGTLTLNANGSYTYVADTGLEGDVEDVFVYTIEDGDGDLSTTTLTITVNDVTISDNDALVDESGLDGIGSQIVPNGEFFTGGQISVEGASGTFTFVLTSPANGTYGTLVLNPNTGTYSYTLDTPFDEQPDANNFRDTINDAESFTYEVHDQNGNVIGTGTIDVDIVDDVPKAFSNTNTVDEGGAAVGNVLTDETPDIFGADGPAATSPAGGVVGVRAANGDTITPVTTGTGTAIAGQYGTLTLNADGSYVYLADTVDQDVQDVFVYTIKDGDGDLATALLTITVNDVTIPDRQPIAGTVSVALDDDAVPGFGGIADGPEDDAPDTSNTSGNLPGSGGDGALTFALLATGVVEGGGATGFTYAKVGNDLQISQDGTVVITVTLTPSTGAYTVTQNAPITHASLDGDPDDNTENNQTFAISYTVKDVDGDTAVGTLNINVDDDTPTATATANTDATVALDETKTASDPATFGVSDIGDDPDVTGSGRIAYANSNGTAVVTAGGGYGADGAGSLSYALSVTNATSGLQTTDGSAINLVNESGVVVGRVSGGDFDGDAAFAIKINSSTGVVEVEQYLSLKHTLNPNPDDTVYLADGSLGVTVTRTDSDNDSVTSTAADISHQISFDDDGPTANDDVDSISGGLGPATGNVVTGAAIVGGDGNATNGVADALGADGPASPVVVGVEATDTDTPLDDANTVGVAIQGTYGKLTIQSNGDYSYTRDDGTAGDFTDIFTYTIKDGDGDTAHATLRIDIGDKRPVAGTVNIALDDDILTNGILDGPEDDDPDSLTFPLTGNLAGSGGDGTLTFTLLATGVVEGGGATGFTYAKVGNDLQISQNGTLVVTVKLTNTATGAYEITQNNPITHASLDGDTGDNTENNQTFAISYTVQDSDGDTATGTLNINVDDDTPTATATANTDATVALDETKTASDPATFGVSDIGDDPDVTGSGRIAYASSGTAVVTAGGGYGADGPGTLSYALSVTNAASGLQVTDGSGITLVNEGGIIVGRVTAGTFEDDAAFAIKINSSTGVVEVEQYLSLKHPINPNPDDTIYLANGSLGVTVTRTDSDNDSVTSTAADISHQISFDDDGPTATATANTQATAALDETKTASDPATFGVSSIGDDPDVTGSGRIAYASSGTAVVTAGGGYGADGPGTLSYALSVTNAASGLQVTDGSGITLVNEGGIIVGRVTAGTFEDDAAFAIKINSSTGVVEVEQYLSLKHPNGGDPDDTIYLANGSLGVTITRTDGDNDSVTSTAADISHQISFDDDGPTATATANTQATAALDETKTASDPATFGVSDIGDDPDVTGSGRIAYASSGTAVVTAGGGYGADGPGTLSYALSVTNAASGLQVTDGSGITLVNEGGIIVGRVTAGTFEDDAAFAIKINSSTGVVEVEQYLSLKHPLNPNPDDTVYLANGSLGVTVTRTDGDTDSVTSTAADISGQISFDDDGPTFTADVQDQQVDSDPTDVANSIATGTLHFAPGADGAGPVGTIGLLTSGLTSDNSPVATYQIGNVLWGYVEAGTADGGIYTPGQDTAIFSLTINPTAASSGQYVFDLIGHLDGGFSDTTIGEGTAFGAGPQNYNVVSATDVSTDPLSVLSAWSVNTGVFDVNDWYDGTDVLPAGLSHADIYGAATGWGVNNGNLNGAGTEFMRFDFGMPLDDFDGAGGYTPSVSANLPDVAYATFTWDPGSELKFVVHHTDGTTRALGGQTSSAGSITIYADDGKLIDWIDVLASNAASNNKIQITSVGARNETVDLDLTFQVTLTDGDGDSVQSDQFVVNVIDNGVPSVPAAPVALDLDGDGVEFLSRSAGVRYDYGLSLSMGLVLTAWVAPDDGLLARQTANGLDIVFTDDAEGATTDLQGLSMAYDSNGDGMLTAGDNAWSEFGVWRDANSDGVTDKGEFHSLDELGITSINLLSDQNGYEAADGDVTVHGEASFAFADGSTGTLADASFTTGTMEALLAMAETSSSTDSATTGVAAGTGDLGAVQEALADASGESFVDQIVDQFASNDTQATGTGDTVGNLTGLLSADVGSDSVSGLAVNDFNQTMEHVDAAIAAAA